MLWLNKDEIEVTCARCEGIGLLQQRKSVFHQDLRPSAGHDLNDLKNNNSIITILNLNTHTKLKNILLSSLLLSVYHDGIPYMYSYEAVLNVLNGHC